MIKILKGKQVELTCHIQGNANKSQIGFSSETMGFGDSGNKVLEEKNLTVNLDSYNQQNFSKKLL